jgi:hypothetical protein
LGIGGSDFKEEVTGIFSGESLSVEILECEVFYTAAK